jgi:S-adenosylmethionine hydrolase
MNDISSSRLVALLTDFGERDGYVAVMKGVMLTRCSGIRFVDITHSISRHSIQSAAFILWNSYRYFPSNTIFLAVVDPGVGTGRDILAVRLQNGRQFVAPDNGCLAYILGDEKDATLVTVDSARYEQTGTTFHGRDIMAPVAAALASGDAVESLGTPVEPEGRGIDFRYSPATPSARIAYIDHFGNMITNIPLNIKVISISAGEITITRAAAAYADAEGTEPVLVKGSSGLWEIAVNKGSAQAQTGLEPGDEIMIMVDG